MLKRASEKKLVSFDVRNIRDYTKDKHNKTDDRPYGGGPGMVMTPEPILRAYQKIKFFQNGDQVANKGKIKVVMLSPSGKVFDNKMAAKWAKQYKDIVFICGRYEGVDDRVRKILKADEISIGDFVLTGGELPALVMTDAICRQIPGVLGDQLSIEESRTASPHVYTRPEILIFPFAAQKRSVKAGKATKTVKGKKYPVPPVLLSGNHKDIDEWRKKQKK